jgi:hypothetical protein
MTTTILTRTDISGTSYVVDVSALDLSTNLSEPDFEVTHNGVVNSGYSKTSPISLSYAGTNVTLGTLVRVRRITGITAGDTNFISTTTAVDLSYALNRLRLIDEELNSFLFYTLNQIALGGITLGVTGAPLFSPAFTGTPTAPTPPTLDSSTRVATTAYTRDLALNSPTLTGTPSAPTPPVGDNSTRIATTAHTRLQFPAATGAGGQLSYTFPGNGLIVKAGSTVVTIAANTATVTFTNAFPTSNLTVVAINGDNSVTASSVNITAAPPLGSFGITTPGYAAGGFRVNWIAIGS